MKEMQKVSSNFEKLRKQGHKKKDTEIRPFIEDQSQKNIDLTVRPLKFPSHKDSGFKKVGFKKAFDNFTHNSADSMDSSNTSRLSESYDRSSMTELPSNPIDLREDGIYLTSY